MDIKKTKPIAVIALVAGVLFATGYVVKDNPDNLTQAANSGTSVSINNTAPTFSVEAAESTASYGEDVGENPIDVGSVVTFQATGADDNTDNYYLAICRSGSITAGDNAAPTCASAGDTFCISTSTADGVQATCDYTADATDDPLESYNWYAYVCDGVTGGGACSSVNQGTGNPGSPVFINHTPTYTNIVTDGAKDPGQTVTFTSTASDADTEVAGTDQLKLVVCADTSGATYAGCAGTELCTSAVGGDNPSCGYAIPAVTENAAYNFYAYVFDSHQLDSADNYRTSTYTVNNVAPVVSSVVVNGAGAIALTENTTTAVNITGTITDQNSCQDLVTTQAFLYMDPTYDYGSGTCDAAGDADNNYCYAEVSCTVDGGTCTGATDASATYTCAVSMQYHANPTATAGNTTDPSYHATDDWKATIKVVDSALTHAVESAAGVEVNKTLGMSITSPISYGAMAAGSDTGTTLDSNADLTTTVESTGNVGLDLSFGGTLMCTDYPTCSGTTIPIANQEYYWAGTSFAWGTGTDLTASGAEEEVNIFKTTVTATKASKKVLWGLGIPAVINSGTYTGQNTLTAYIGESANWQ